MNPTRLLRLALGTRRALHSSAALRTKEIAIQRDGDRIVVFGIPQATSSEALSVEDARFAPQACVLCKLALPLAYSDVLILDQFMRKDGTVLPPEVTGLCRKQQTKVEALVMQAHWVGLFPSSPEPTGFRRQRRYWTDPKELFERNLEVRAGSWYYIQRHVRRGPEQLFPRIRPRIWGAHKNLKLRQMGYRVEE